MLLVSFRRAFPFLVRFNALSSSKRLTPYLLALSSPPILPPRSHLGAHSDTLSNIGPQAIVTGISLGAKRVFVVQETLPWGTKTAAVGDGSGARKKVTAKSWASDV